MKYLTVDAYLHGTGIKDQYNGGFTDPLDLGLNADIIYQISIWLSKYEKEHFNGFANKEAILALDAEGREIARKIKEELIDVKMEYISAATMAREIIDP